MDWTKSHVFSTLHICWGALAGLYHHFGIPKYDLPEKVFGVFLHEVKQKNVQLLRGFDDCFYGPHSRLSEVRREDILAVPQLQILTESQQAGVHIVANNNGRQYFITGHLEYDRSTLAEEYQRDRDKGIDIAVPHHYFPDDDPTKPPLYTWGCSANLLFSNWINHCVYQLTPYDLQRLDLYNWNWEAGL
jgi:homoserine O-succinyltransferase